MSQHDFVKQTLKEILAKLDLTDSQMIQIQPLRINKKWLLFPIGNGSFLISSISLFILGN